MSLPSILPDSSNHDRKHGQHIVDESLKNYFNSFPSESLIREIIGNAFVINEPMSGVGGDGYWIHGKNDEVFLVVFDCMGHGRMASIMTRIYLNAIKSAIVSHGIDQTAKILHFIHENIRNNLLNETRQSIGSGADIAVVKYHITERTISYAGACIDLVYVNRNGITRIKGHKRQVGDHFDRAREYETHKLTIGKDEETSFFLYTDGATDLIGGAARKKLKFSGLSPILKKAHQLPIHQSRAHVHNELLKWNREEDRLDDLLMVSFRT